MENAQKFKSELSSKIGALQGDLQRLEVELNARAGDIENNVKLSFRDMTTMHAQEVERLAAQIWHELEEEHQEHCQGLSRLSGVVSELVSRISGEEDGLPNVVKLLKCGSTPNFGQTSFSDARSSIALQSSGERSCTAFDFTLNSPFEHSQDTGSPHFSTPSPNRNISAPGCRLGGLTWFDQDWAAEPKVKTLKRVKGTNLNSLRAQVEEGGCDDKEGEAENTPQNTQEKKFAIVGSRNNGRRMVVDLINILGSVSEESVCSSKPDTSALTGTAATSQSPDETGRGIHREEMEGSADLTLTLYSTSCEDSDQASFDSEVATRPSP